MAQTFVRNRVTWLSYLMQALYGFFLNIFGPITPFLKNELGLSYTLSSLHFSAFALGIIGVGIAGSSIIHRFGRRKALWVGTFGISAGTLLLIAGHNPILTIGASFIMGLVGSLILAVLPSVMSDQHGDLRAVAYSEANVISSLISAVAPVLVGWFAGSAFGWRAAPVVGVVWAAAMYVTLGKVELPAAQSASAADQGQNRVPALYWFYWGALVVAVSVEFCMIFWSADYMEVVLGMAKASAAQAVSLFLAGMIVGRLASSRLVLRFSLNLVITSSLLIAAAGFLIYWTAAGPIVGMIGLFLTGLGVSSLYPLILSLAIASAGRATVRAGAYASLASGVAIFFLPLILGHLADALTIRPAYVIVLVLIIVDILIVTGIGRFKTSDYLPGQA